MLKRLRLVILLFAGIGLLVLGWLQFNGELFVDSRFRDKKVLGKTADEIIHVDGLPVVDSRSQGDPPDGSDNFKLIYFSGFQNILIRFEHGRAVEVTHSAK